VGLPAPWVRHLKDQESKQTFEQTVRASVTALSRLYDLLEENERSLLNQETDLEDFNSTDWAFKQAFRNGRKSQIKELKQLLEFIKG
jgi:hypothetical protein